jgi:recombination protein RecA
MAEANDQPQPSVAVEEPKPKKAKKVDAEPEIDRDALLKAIAVIRKKHGKGAIMYANEDRAKIDIQRWSTGLPDLDEVIGGGMPRSRIIEIWGQESAGKSSLCYQLAARAPMTYWIDSEGTADIDRASRVFGCNPKKILLEPPESGEGAFESIYEMVKANMPLIVVDSAPALVPHRVAEKLAKDAKGETYAGVASLMSKCLPMLVNHLQSSRSTVVFINQVRDKIGIIFGDPQQLPCGHALKHYKSLSLQVYRRGWIGPKENRVGQICAVRVVKSKVSQPFKACELHLSFDSGFVDPVTSKAMEKEANKAAKVAKASAREQIEDEMDEDEE